MKRAIDQLLDRERSTTSLLGWQIVVSRLGTWSFDRILENPDRSEITVSDNIQLFAS